MVPELVYGAVRAKKFSIASHDSTYYGRRVWTVWNREGFIVGTYFDFIGAVWRLDLELKKGAQR